MLMLCSVRLAPSILDGPFAIDETLTLSHLYDFCNHNPDGIALYFHNNGSYHTTMENLYFRNFLDCYVLNTHCVDALLSREDKLDTCDMNFVYRQFQIRAVQVISGGQDVRR